MQIVGPGLGNHLDVGAAEAPVLRVVAVGDDGDILHRVFAGGDHRRAAPDRAHGADSIDSDAVGFILAAAGLNLRPVFRLEDSGGAIA